jgi:cytochrome c oxidase subunit 2
MNASMKRDLAIVALLSVALTALGELLAQTVTLYPVAHSDKGRDIDHAFHVLLLLAVPVFAIVVVSLGYSVFRYRVARRPDTDGPPLFGRGVVPVIWLAVTAGLTLVIMVYPGLTDLGKVTANDAPDLTVEVQGVQWAWIITYPQQNVKAVDELVLPVNRTVHFEITSLDVIHSFWIPALRMKQDAVPGLTTSVTVRPTQIDAYATDPEMRLQCSQMCGLDHARMRMPVRVVSETDFEDWIATHAVSAATPAGGAAPAAAATTLSIAAKNTKFSTSTLQAAPGQPIALTFRNDDTGVVHNFVVLGPDGQPEPGAKTSLTPGPDTQTITFTIATPGSYTFRCDAHPTQMTGTLVVK